MALDLDTSPVIGAMGLIPLLSKWRRLKVPNIATELEEERQTEEGKGRIRQTVLEERGGARTMWSEVKKGTKTAHHFQK